MGTDYQILREMLARAGYSIIEDDYNHSIVVADDLEKSISFFFTPLGALVALAAEED